MKVSDMMLDIKSGTASVQDAYIEEALGKINVASSYFDSADMILEALLYEPETLEDEVVQEAVKNAKLPTDENGATKMGNTAIAHEMNALYDITLATAKKLHEKVNTLMGVLIGKGKTYGISPSAIDNGNFVTVFAKPLAKAIVDNNGATSVNTKGIRNAAVGLVISDPLSVNRASKKEYWTKSALTFENRNFLRGDKALTLARDYGTGVAYILACFGLNLNDIFNDDTLKKYMGYNDQTFGGKLFNDTLAIFRIDPETSTKQKSGYSAKSATSLRSMGALISKGYKIIENEKVFKSQLNYRGRVDADELTEFIVSVYAIKMITEGIIKNASKNDKKKLGKVIGNIIANSEKSAKKSLNDDIKNTGAALKDTTNNIIETFTTNVELISKMKNN